MTDPWEEAWTAINAAMADVAATLRSQSPRLWWSYGRHENESFPFWAYASFSRAGVAGEEDVVISLDFKRNAGELVFSSDIARGDGEILADGPTARLALATDTGSVRAWIQEQVSAGLEFVEANHPLLQRELV